MKAVKDRHEGPIHRKNMMDGEREPPHPHTMREGDKGSSSHVPPGIGKGKKRRKV